MARKHQDVRWVRLRAKVKPRLIALLPAPCPRCGNIMEKGQDLDLGHITRQPAAAYDEGNLRLEHRACNRRDGQRIPVAKRATPNLGKRMPSW